MMSIVIRKHPHGYVVTTTRPDVAEDWATESPLTAEGVLGKLTQIGCHPRDVMDWIDFADQLGEWGVR
jgi:hypothetical protein